MAKLSVITVAERAGVSQYTIRDFIRKQFIPHYRIGKRIVFDEEEIQAWLQARRVPEVDGKITPRRKGRERGRG